MHRTCTLLGILTAGLASTLFTVPVFAEKPDTSSPQVEAAVVSAPTEETEALPAETPETSLVEIESTEETPTPRVGRTWQFYSRESCYDMFGRSCQQSHFPAPFCPPNPAGKACSGSPYRCFVIISSHWADEYLCQP